MEMNQNNSLEIFCDDLETEAIRMQYCTVLLHQHFNIHAGINLQKTIQDSQNPKLNLNLSGGQGRYLTLN